MDNIMKEIQFLYDNNKYDEVITYIGYLEQIGRLNVELLLLKTKSMILQDNIDEAMEYITKREDLFIGDRSIGLYIAELYEEMGNHFKALKYYARYCNVNDLSQLIKVKKMRNNLGKVKIALISNNSSGCNSSGLFKNIPEMLHEKYDIRLIKEQPDGSLDAFASDSELVITTHLNYRMNNRQLNMELWHGFPLKAMANMDNSESKTPKTVSSSWDSVDYIFSYSPMFNTLFNACVGTSINKYVNTGAARNDLLASAEISDLERMFNKNFDGQKIVFFIPTFRSVYSKTAKNEGDRHWNNLFGFNDFFDETFYDFLEEHQIQLFVKLHPVEESIYQEAVTDLSNARVHLLTNSQLEEANLDLYEVLGNADMLITDYSSIYFDFLLTNKPVIFTPVDFDEYKKKRGLLLEPYDFWTPGPKVTTQSLLQSEIQRSLYDSQYYQMERDMVVQLVHQYKDFKSSERIWEFIDQTLDLNMPEEVEKLDFPHIKSIEDLKKQIAHLIEMNEVERAEFIISIYEQEFKNSSDFKTIESTISYIKGDLKKALVCLHHAYFNDPLHQDTLYNLGYIYEELGHMEAANFFYNKISLIGAESELVDDVVMRVERINAAIKKSQNNRILIASPIYQKPEVLVEFLISLNDLDKEGFEVGYFFVDDNRDEHSSELIERFIQDKPSSFVMKSNDTQSYDTHLWYASLVWKVAAFKEDMMRYAKINNYDYIFFIDSDLVLDPRTLKQLYSQQVDIVSNIFWTKWDLEEIELPQVWLKDHYSLFERKQGESLTGEEMARRSEEFINKLRNPGLYRVGGLGACTLISRHAIERGISFKEVPNISFNGEDRHFCIRAAAIGLDLYVDTHYPALHLYRDQDLLKVADFKNNISSQIQ